MPALRALARTFSSHRLLLTAPEWLRPLVAPIHARLELLATRELDVPSVRAPDLAVNLHGRGPQSHRALLSTFPRLLIAYEHADVEETAGGPRWDDSEHEVRRWSRLLGEHGIAVDEGDLDLEPPRAEPPTVAAGATVIHPGAAAPARRWPADRWAAVAAAEVSGGHTVVLTGSAEERPLAERIARTAGLPPGCVLAGRTDLDALVATVAAAGRVACGDTGVAHLATALGTPSVVLFGPTDPARWGPPPERPSHAALWKGRTGDPHGPQPDPGLLEIRPDEVIDALAGVPDRASAGAP